MRNLEQGGSFYHPFIYFSLIPWKYKMTTTPVSSTQPEFILEEYFLGSTRAWGIFEDRFGNLRRQFTVDIKGSWVGEDFLLDEFFAYDDGKDGRRVWRIRNRGARGYEGRADDVIGMAIGEVSGNTLNWRYKMVLGVGKRSWRVRFDDRMFLQPDGVLINRARVKKFGITIGEVTIVFVNDTATLGDGPLSLSQSAGVSIGEGGQ